MDSSVSETYGQQEGTAYNGHFEYTCYHPLFCFNQFGDLEQALLRNGNVHIAEDWRAALEPAVARYRDQDLARYFRGDAAFAKPDLYESPEEEGYKYAIRLPANDVLEEKIRHLLTRPVGRPPKKPIVLYACFLYRAASWNKWRRVVAKMEWHEGELFPRIGFIVTNLWIAEERVVRFYNGRGTAEQWTKEGKQAIKWTRLSCQRFDANQVRLQLFVLAYNLANFVRRLALPQSIRRWSLTTLREKLVKIGAKVVRHAGYITFQLAEVAVSRRLFGEILCRIERLRALVAPAPSCALKNGAKHSPFGPSLRSRYVRRGKNDPIRAVKAGILIENGSEPSPTIIGKPLISGDRVGIVHESWLMGAIWEMSDYCCQLSSDDQRFIGFVAIR